MEVIMPAPEPHLGQWNLVLNSQGCELNTVEAAIHACVIVTNQSSGNWKVLYFTADIQDKNGDLKSFMWDPANPDAEPSSQIIPPWPNGAFDQRIFCSGHSFLPDGRLFVAGGNRDPILPPPGCPQVHQFRGIPYTYIFNPVNESWSVATNPTTG
jgi:hypothetical protein